MKYLMLTLALPFLSLTKGPKENYLIVGTYTGGKSEGIYVYTFNSDEGSFREISHIKTSNPSFVAISPDKKFVYAVHENAQGGNGGEISAFAFDKKKGELTYINQQKTEGDHPCYVEVDNTGKWVFAGNYSSGSLSVLPVNTDGSLGEATSHINHTGSGKNKDRQEKPHVHCTLISPDNKWLFVPDLGIDKVMIYGFDDKTGKLTPASTPFAASTPGAGPRHFTFHPNGKFAYLIEELSGHVVAYQYGKGKLKQLQRISTVPRGQKGFAGSADIHVSPDGKFLYASNRGDFNNIAIYKVDTNTGKLSIIGFQPTLGAGPRNFNFDPSGNYLLVGNQANDEIVIFKRNLKTGLLADTGKRIEVGKPVCLKWISKE
ncbi:lactonase family protein [Terrimonas pollutisoli]|uniref:lactonase family protein n=1 Tax=Terrimonas pollutisoli TaxID=3034147 RepID=UPI0023EB4A7E|nr:lactonase family protein [Terrimonas sp. H1YJ31]